jgi:hypothetical protein
MRGLLGINRDHEQESTSAAFSPFEPKNETCVGSGQMTSDVLSKRSTKQSSLMFNSHCGMPDVVQVRSFAGIYNSAALGLLLLLLSFLGWLRLWCRQFELRFR